MISAIAAAAVAAGLTGCGTMPIAYKDAVQSIEKVAVVSVSANERIYNAKGGPKSDAEYGDLKKKAEERKEYTGKTTDTTQETTEEIVQTTPGIYMEVLGDVADWELIPVSEVKDMPAYQQAEGEPVDEKHFIPTLVIPGTKYYNPFRDNRFYREQNQKTEQALMELCQAMDVDAVMVLRTKLGYEPQGMQLLGGLGGLLAGKKTKAKPTVGTGILVLTKNGARAVYTVTEMKYQGPEVSMLQAGLVNFTGDEGPAVKAYEQAIEAIAQALAERIKKDLAQ